MATKPPTPNKKEIQKQKERQDTTPYRFAIVLYIYSILLILLFAQAVSANIPPTMSNIGNNYVLYDNYVNITLNATDTDGDTLTYSTNASGVLSGYNYSWKPTYLDIGNYSVNFGVNDGNGGIDNETVFIHVYDTYFKHYSDNFNDNNLNNSFFLNMTTGTATLSETGGQISIAEDSIDDGGYISPNRSFSLYTVSTQFNFSQVTAGYTGIFIENQTGLQSDINYTHSKFSILGFQNTGKIEIGFFGTDDVWRTWNGSTGAWGTGNHGTTFTVKTNFTFQIEHNKSAYRGTVYNNTNSVILQSDWVDITDVANGNYDDYILIGDVLDTKANMDFTLDNFSIGYLSIQSIDKTIQFRRVGDNRTGMNLSESMSEIVELNPDFIFQGTIIQLPMYESCLNYSTSELQNACNDGMFSVEHLRNITNTSHTQLPNTMFGGGFLFEFMNKTHYDSVTNITYSENDTWGLSFSPQDNWGFGKNRTQFQDWFAISRGWTTQAAINNGSYVSKRDMHYYYPDINNVTVRQIYLNLAKVQIDAGVDVIWVDGMFGTADMMYDDTGNINNISVNDSYNSANIVITDIHNYSASKNKYVPVISWVLAYNYTVIFDSSLPNDLDGFMTSIAGYELNNVNLHETKWTNIVGGIRNHFGSDKSIFTRIDYGNTNSPLSILSQTLTTCQAAAFLNESVVYFNKKNVNFIYPIYGGNMGSLDTPATKLSYGTTDWYDSNAPEFNTYNTMKALLTNTELPDVCETFALSGYVKNSTNVLNNSNVSYSGGYNLTNSSGYYIIQNIENGTYNFTVSLSGYSSNVTSKTISGTNLTNQNFTLSIPVTIIEPAEAAPTTSSGTTDNSGVVMIQPSSTITTPTSTWYTKFRAEGGDYRVLMEGMDEQSVQAMNLYFNTHVYGEYTLGLTTYSSYNPQLKGAASYFSITTERSIDIKNTSSMDIKSARQIQVYQLRGTEWVPLQGEEISPGMYWISISSFGTFAIRPETARTAAQAVEYSKPAGSEYLNSINALLEPVSYFIPPVKGHELEAVLGTFGVSVLVVMVLRGRTVSRPRMKKWAWRKKA